MATIGSLNLKLGLNSASFDVGLGNAASKLQSFASMASSVFAGVGAANIFSSAISGVQSLGGAMLNLGTDAVKTAADIESITTSLSVMTGSTEKAKETISTLQKLAANTPFTMQTLLPATQRLMAFGFEAKEATGLLSRLGNLAAASPDGMEEGVKRMTVAIGQMRAKNRVMLQEVNQLTEASIPALDAIATKLGVSAGEAMKQIELGAVSAQTGIEALLDLSASPKFAGLMERQSKDFKGQASTLVDTWRIGLAGLGQTLMDAFNMKGVQRDITSLVTSISVSLEPLKPVLYLVGDIFRATWEVGLAMGKEFLRMIGTLGPQVDGVKPSFVEIRKAVIDFAEMGTAALMAFGFWSGKIAGMVIQNFTVPLIQNFKTVMQAIRDISADIVARMPLIAANMGLTDATIRMQDRFINGLEQTKVALMKVGIAAENFTMADLERQMKNMTKFFDTIRNKVIDSNAAGAVLGAGFVAGFRGQLPGAVAAIDELKIKWGEVAKVKNAAMEFKTPGLVQKGSKEAFSAMNAWINEGRGGAGGKGEALAKPMDALVRIQEMAKELQKLQLAQLQKIAANVAPLVLGKV